METLNIESNILGKKISVYYQTYILYTTSPKYFMKFYRLNEVEEFGVCLKGGAISKQVEANKQGINVKIIQQVTDKFIPTESAQEAINNYKTALKVIDVEEVNRIKTWRQIWEKIKKDIVNPNIESLDLFGLVWLFSSKSLESTAWLATLCLLCNLNLYEVIRMFKASWVGSQEQKLLESQVWHMGLVDLIDNPVKREDLQLYMKVKNENNLKFS